MCMVRKDSCVVLVLSHAGHSKLASCLTLSVSRTIPVEPGRCWWTDEFLASRGTVSNKALHPVNSLSPWTLCGLPTAKLLRWQNPDSWKDVLWLLILQSLNYYQSHHQFFIRNVRQQWWEVQQLYEYKTMTTDTWQNKVWHLNNWPKWICPNTVMTH